MSDVSQKAREVVQKWFNANTNLDIVGSLVPVIEAYGLRRAIEEAELIHESCVKMNQWDFISWMGANEAALRTELAKLEGK